MNVVKLCNLFIVVLLFLFCGSIYPIIFGANALYLLLLVLSIASLLFQKNYNNDKLLSFSKATGILLFFLTLNWILTGFDLSFTEYPVLYGVILIFNIALLALANREDTFGYSFDFVFKIIVIYSLLNFIVTNLFKGLFIPFANDGYACNHFFYLFFYVAEHNILGVEMVRNQGFYWEPGVLGVILNIFLFRLLFGNKTAYGRILTFLTAFLIFTTFSTTGLIILFLQFTYFIFISKRNAVKKIGFLILFFLILTPTLITNVNEKVSGKGETSFILRNYDALVALDVAKDNFLTGVGFSKVRNKEAQEKSPIYMNSDFTEAHGNTNSITTVFLYLGIPLGLAYLFLLYNQKIITYNKGFFFLILLVCLMSEPLIFYGFFIFFASSYFYKLNYEF